MLQSRAVWRLQSVRASRQTAGTAEGAEEGGGGGGQGKVQVAANCSNQPTAKASRCKRNVSCCGYIASYQTGEEVGACSSGGAKRESTMIAAASRQEVVQAAAGARTEMHKSRQLANGALEEKRPDTFGHKLISIFWGIGGGGLDFS